MILLCSFHESVCQRWRKALVEWIDMHELHAAHVIGPYLAAHDAQLMLLHISLPGLDGIRGVAALRSKYPRLKLIVFNDVPDEEEGIELLKQGVHGYANTYMSPDLFVEAIKVVQSGEVWVGRKLMQRLITDLASANQQRVTVKDSSRVFDSLTGREKEIMLFIGAGSSNKRIASRLDITERTVKAHLSSIFRKTNTHDRLQLALLLNRQPTETLPAQHTSSSVI